MESRPLPSYPLEVNVAREQAWVCSNCGQQIHASSALKVNNMLFCSKSCMKEYFEMVRDAQKGK
jgi:formylmethanofuran dehydrogenase subunit E